MVVLGIGVSPWLILTLPAALLIGFAFGAVGMAATSFMRTWQDFDLIQLVDPADVPVLRHVLPDRRRTRGRSSSSSSSRRCTRASTCCGRWRSGSSARTTWSTSLYLTVMGIAGLLVVSRRLDRLLLK